ncbi:MAG: hypothetical protein KGK04_10620 [Xanthomonadaceae bacterium]|nr:hypothetical protein [Xanthomonadaceae bacterium]
MSMLVLAILAAAALVLADARRVPQVPAIHDRHAGPRKPRAAAAEEEDVMRVSNRMICLGMLVSAATLAMALPAVARAPAPPAQAASTAASDATAAMLGNMQTMREQMAKLHATTDPKRRARLLDEHLATMQATMQLMMANRGGCPAGGGMMGRGPMGGGGMMGKGMTGPGQGGMGMMQMMMEQMVQHQNAMRGPGR